MGPTAALTALLYKEKDLLCDAFPPEFLRGRRGRGRSPAAVFWVLVVTPGGKAERFPKKGPRQTFPVNAETAGTFSQTRQADVGILHPSNTRQVKPGTDLKDHLNTVSLALMCALYPMATFPSDRLGTTLFWSGGFINVWPCRRPGSLFLIRFKTGHRTLPGRKLICLIRPAIHTHTHTQKSGGKSRATRACII